MTLPQPQQLSVAKLAALDGREFANELRVRLRRDDAWLILLDPALVERTRWNLVKIITSVDAQRERADRMGTTTAEWLKSINALQRWAQERLAALPPAPIPDLPLVSGSKEARAWRALSAQLASVLEVQAPEVLDRLQAPYGGLTVAQWLKARREKELRA